MEPNRKRIVTGNFAKVFALAGLLLCSGADSVVAKGQDIRKSSISISGQGVAPNVEVSLSTGGAQKIVTKADRGGHFVFSNLQYSSLSDLRFSLDLPPNPTGLVNNASGNHLEFLYDPRGSKTRVSGTIGKSGLLTVSVAGAKEPLSQIAGAEGYVTLQTRTGVPISSGESKLVASIVNVGEACCPRLFVPAPPVMLTVSSIPVAMEQPVEVPKVTVPATTSPVLAPQTKQAPVAPGKYILAPGVAQPNATKPSPEQKSPQQEEPKQKKKIPYIVQGKMNIETLSFSGEQAYAASFSSSDYDNTYVGGLKKMADDKRNEILFRIGALGSFMDGRALMDTLRSLEVSMAQSLKNYTVSDSICQFGTLSRSLALSDDVRYKNRLAFSKIMFDRANQKMNSVYSDPGATSYALLTDFKDKYCEAVDNASFLQGYCKAATATSDLLYNRDIDFTRVFDVPLTVNADFTDTNQTNDKQALIALFHNLALSPYYMASNRKGFDPNRDLITSQDTRAINAAKEVAENSFGALVAEKVKVSSQSATYMKQVLTSLGASSADASKLIGDSPSYFAQMEVMTKRLYQNPNFYANLYDSAANVDRQRVAMKAVELQQDRDFLESLRRREMLLSVLLEMKLRTEASRANESGVVHKR